MQAIRSKDQRETMLETKLADLEQNERKINGIYRPLVVGLPKAPRPEEKLLDEIVKGLDPRLNSEVTLELEWLEAANSELRKEIRQIPADGIHIHGEVHVYGVRIRRA